MADFVRVGFTGDLPEGKMKKVIVGGSQVLVANVKGRYYAIGNVCTHFGGSLDQGVLNGQEVQCPLHGSRFDVTTGQAKRGPASKPEPVYEIKVEKDNVLVRTK